jgi:CRISPR-associated protein Cas2
MRSVYIVCYDIADPKRLQRVYKTMRGFGEHLQLSVFRCELSARERVEMIAALTPIIHHDEDQVLVVDVGPATGRSETAFHALGKTYVAPQRHAIVL